MAVTLTPEAEARLRQGAERAGQDVNTLADEPIADSLPDVDDPRDLTQEEMAEIRAGIQRGLDAAAAGRVKPLSRAI